jgi:hypothetical protein
MNCRIASVAAALSLRYLPRKLEAYTTGRGPTPSLVRQKPPRE